MPRNAAYTSAESPPVSRADWDSWQKAHGSPFQASCFSDSLSMLDWRLSYFAKLDESGAITDTLVAARKTRLGMPWVSFFAEPSTSSSDLLAAAIDEYLEKRRDRPAFLQSIGSMGRWSSEQLAAVEHKLPSYRSEPFGTYEILLNLPEKSLWDGLHSKHRNVIRSAEKNAVTVVERGADFDPLELSQAYDLLVGTLARGDTEAPSRQYFTSISEGWLRSGFAKLFLALHDNTIKGCAIIPFTRRRAYYWFGGSKPASELPLGTNNLLQWSAMLAMKRAQVEIYDFGGARPTTDEGSKLEGIQKFKERFGGTFVATKLWKADMTWAGPVLRTFQKWKRRA